MKLAATTRDLIGKKVKTLRAEGQVPASVYGPNKPSTDVTFDKKEFIKLFKTVGFNRFFDLEVEGSKPAKVLVKEIQKNPVNDHLISVSLYQVAEDRKISVEVPIEFIGESPAVKLNLGFLLHQMDRIELHCFPKDLPNILTVDISTLQNPGDAITVGDLKLPEDVELSSSMEASPAIVYIATAQKEEEVVAATPAEGEAATTADQPAAEEKKAE